MDFPGFPTPGAGPDIAAIAERQRERVYKWFNARIAIYDDDRIVTTPYDPTDDEGGESSPALVYDSGVNGARVQPLNSRRILTTGAQPTGERTFLVQTKLDLDISIIRHGLRLLVLDGGEDESLRSYRYTVQSAANSSYAWNRSIICTALMTNTDTGPASLGLFPSDDLEPDIDLEPEIPNG